MQEKASAILDTSVLINFLILDRVGLLSMHPRLRFLVTEHVRAEIADHYPEQRQRLETALGSGLIGETTVTGTEALDLFATLARDGRLGVGECSAIAAATTRRVPLAMDDRRARRSATPTSHPRPSVARWQRSSTSEASFLAAAVPSTAEGCGQRNFNPIDPVMVQRAYSFLEAVDFLQGLLPRG